MASIRQRGGNSYAVVFQNGEGEARQQVWESGYTQAEANLRKAQIEHEESRGIKTHTISEENHGLLGKAVAAAQGKKDKAAAQMNFANQQTAAEIRSTNDALLFLPFMEDFIRVYGSKKWGTSYYKGTMSLLHNYIYPYWKDVPITDVTVKDVDIYYTQLIAEGKASTKKHRPKRAKAISASTVNDIHKVLRCAFNRVLKWQYIDSNPFIHATLPEFRSKVRPALTPDEVKQVLDFTDNPDDYDLFLVHCAVHLAFSGSMRGGEIGALQWDDIIDPQNRIVYISKSIDRVDRAALDTVSKTKVFFQFPSFNPRAKSVIVLKNTKEDGGSDRNCYLSPTVYDKLMMLKSMQEELKSLLGYDGYYDYDMMICQANGKPIMTEHLNKKFQVVLDEMNIRPKKGDEQYVFHSLRSSATTYKLRVSGGDIKAVQGENGQKDPKMVTEVYSRILEEDRRRISELMAADFYSEGGNSGDDVLQVAKDNPELFRQFAAFMSMTTGTTSANNI